MSFLPVLRIEGSSFEVNERAFTVIELMIVLAIMGILATLSMEGYRALLARHQLQGVSRMLVSDLRSIQQQALITRQRYWIRFDPEQNEYSVWAAEEGEDRLYRRVKIPTPVRFGTGPRVLGPPSDPAEITEKDGITFRDNQLLFLPSGGLGTGAGTIYITDDPNGTGTRAITITVAGHVRHYSWTGSGWR
jgi:prepilin-type N-terminal cleavage/methylation domain-containing protein